MFSNHVIKQNLCENCIANLFPYLSLDVGLFILGKVSCSVPLFHTVCLLDTQEYAGGMKSISDKGCVPRNQKNINSRGNRRLKKQGQ